MEAFTINKTFAASLKREKERQEYKRLKQRYANVKVKDKKSTEANESSLSEDTDAYSSSSEDAAELAARNNDDFLELVTALDTDDPRLKDPDHVWFPERDESSTSSDGCSDSEPKKKKPILLKDFERETLLANGVMEDERLIEAGQKVSRMDSDDILRSLQDDQSAHQLKEDFVRSIETTQPIKKEKKAAKSKKAEEKKASKPFDPSSLKNVKLSATGDEEAENFLRRFFLEQRWLNSLEDEPITIATASKLTDQSTAKSSLVEAEDDDDSAWLVPKKSQNESADNFSSSEEEEIADIDDLWQKKAEHRAADEERPDDHASIRTYPRKIGDSLRQTHARSRSEKRRERRERKQAEKRQKMAELCQLRKLEEQQLTEKIDRIKKTAGISDDSKARDMLARLEDEDWDPDQHDALVKRLFDQQYYEQEVGDEKPTFSDDGLELTEDEEKVDPEEEAEEEIQKEEEQGGQKRRRGRKGKKRSRFQSLVEGRSKEYDAEKYPDFEQFINKVYKIECEDIINGQKPGEDIQCRFQWRKTKPNDFGLTTEEILFADEKDLNKWVSVKRMSQYRTDEEESRDLAKFHAQHKQSKKAQVLASFYAQPDKEESDAEADNKAEDDDDAKKPKSRRRKRKRLATDKPSSDEKIKVAMAESSRDDNQFLMISEDRLKDAGLSSKQLKKMKYASK